MRSRRACMPRPGRVGAGTKLALELGQLIEKKGGILVQQNTSVAATALTATHTGALEQLHQAVGDLLFSPARTRGHRVTTEAPAEGLDPREPAWPVEEEPELPFPGPDDADPPAEPAAR